METKILDEKGYPFEITPEAITTNFALFQKLIDNRRQLTLVLSDETIDDVANENDTDNCTGGCIATGYFSYAGDKPGSHKWISKIIPVGQELSRPAIEALKSDIWKEVNKIFKGEVSDKQVTSERRMSDIIQDEPTHPNQVIWENDHTEPIDKIHVGDDTLKGDIELQSIKRRLITQERPNVIM